VIITKIIPGFVIQYFNTEKNKYISQEFAILDDGEAIDYDYAEEVNEEDMNKIYDAPDLPYDMVQPVVN
jgi:hypothetical protein